MAPLLPNGSKKRKQPVEEKEATPEPEQIPINIGLDVDSDGEGGDESEDDGEVDVFPALDPDSDTDEEDEEDNSEEDEDGEEEGDEDTEETSEDEDEEEEDGTLPGVYPKPKIVTSKITGQPKKIYPEIEPEYDSDSSTEDQPNRVGNVPLHWYDDLPHIGYSIEGKKVLRPARGDELDKFLATVDDPSSWTTAFDKNAQSDKPLTAQELDLIRRLQENENPDAEYDPYEPTVEWFTGKGKEEVMPLSAKPEPKRRWVPSKWEKQKVMKIVRAIREGRIIPSKPKTTSAQPQYYNLWSTPSADHPPPLPAPKPPLPTNSESYNPPEEYLFDDEERKAWESTDKEDREQDYMPQKHKALRLVPGYNEFIRERFYRQLDLYMAPRVQRKKLNIDPDSMIPKLPSPESLRPFPNYRALKFVAHEKGAVRAVSVSPDGAWVVSGDESGVVYLWEVLVGCPVEKWKFPGKIGALEWCPRTDVCYFVVGIEERLHFLYPPNLPPTVLAQTQAVLSPATLPPAAPTPSPIKWHSVAAGASTSDSPVLTLDLPKSTGLVKQIVWHRRGDYVATVAGLTQTSVWIHQMTRRHSQSPFRKAGGAVQLVQFHPTKPYFFVATQKHVRMYDLAQQTLLKTLMPGLQWISSMDVHPSGDHVIVGGYDRKLCWFDLELSDKPYKVLRYHTRAIRSLQFHPTYPLFMSTSDDGSIQLFHARVFNDLMTDALIVPLKILKGHEITNSLGVLQGKWVPGKPWLASAGADGIVSIWCT